MLSRGDSHHPAQRIARSIHHLHRIGSLNGGTVSQSTISIMTHRPDRAVPLQIHCVINTRGDPHHSAQRDCPIHPKPAPGWFYSWWYRHPVGQNDFCLPPRPCRPPSNTPCKKIPRRPPPSRSADCLIRPPPVPGWFYSVLVPSPSWPK